MSWDFSTDPDFQEQLDWMSEFVRTEIWPLESIWNELGLDGLSAAMAPLQEQVKDRGLWATHLPPELGGQGMGQVRLGLMHEILGTSPIAPLAFGNAAPDSGNSEILALSGTPEQKDRWLYPLLAGDLRSAFSMTEPGTPGSDPTQLQHTRRARRRRLGHRRPQVVLLQRLDRRLPDRDGGDATPTPARPSGPRCSSCPSTRPGVEIVRDVPTMEHPWEHFGAYGGHAEIRYDGVRVGADALLGRRGRGVRAGPAPARPGPHPPLHALARGRAAGLRHDVRARHLPRGARLGPGARSRPCRTGSPTARPRCRRRG